MTWQLLELILRLETNITVSMPLNSKLMGKQQDIQGAYLRGYVHFDERSYDTKRLKRRKKVWTTLAQPLGHTHPRILPNISSGGGG